MIRRGRPVPRKVGVRQSVCVLNGEKTIAKFGVPRVSPVSSEGVVSLNSVLIGYY